MECLDPTHCLHWLLTLFWFYYCSTLTVGQGFMSVRRHEKLNLLIEFSNSIFIKSYLKHFVIEISFKIHWCTRFLLFKAIYLSSRCKKARIFQRIYPVNPEEGSAMNPFRSLRHFEKHSKIKSYFKKQT